MKRYIILFILMVIGAHLFGQGKPEVIMAGDYPDPSIIRDGKDYYMTHSPFYYAPGFLIWHSQDLKHWEPICRALPEYKGSAMAPDLVKYNNRFYIYYPAAGTNWVIWSDSIKGPWSTPIDLKVGGIDPGHIVGKDGHRYLFLSEGYVVQLAADGLSTVGERKKVYDGWQYPKNWKTECMCLEAPKLMYKNGYYYLLSAEGGTAGPATSHMVIAARSKSLFGPWENSPYNPIVHTYSENDAWWSKGHGTLIDDINGNWWLVYHAYAKDYHTLGRQTLLEPVKWTSDGWFQTTEEQEPGQTPIKAEKEIKGGMQLSDDFDGPSIGLQWTFWKEYAPQAVTVGHQQLRLQAKGSSPASGRLLLTTPTDKNYETEVEVEVGKNNSAGLVLFYNEKAFSGIAISEQQIILYRDDLHRDTLKNKWGTHLFLKIHNRGNNLELMVSKDGAQWETLARDVEVSSMNHNHYGGFYALRIGLVSYGEGRATFAHFKYKNAVPTEKDMRAYLMVYFKDETHSLYMALSPDGYSFTDINSGKPIMAGDSIALQKGIRDPHIMRGPDGGFYLAMTDLHIYGKKAGYRTTQWERDGKEYAWGNNRDLVLMKSWDLIHWKKTIMRFDTLAPEFKEIGCVWAPETIYDSATGKLMLYFTMRFKNGTNKLYYSYVNDDFNQIETAPRLLFEYPNPSTSVIDGDITKVGGKYRMFYVAHDGQSGIKQAVSDKIHEDYKFDPRWYDPEKVSCEAPTVWKRIGEDKWVLMYDVFGLSPSNFGFSETSDFINFKNLGYFNDGVMKSTNFSAPKHGAVIQLTLQEAEQLAARWGMNFDSLIKPNVKNPILKGAYADPDVLFSKKTQQYYIYPTSDGFKNWSGTYFKTFCSRDLKTWRDEGVILDLKNDVSWAKKGAWAPSIIEKKDKSGHYKYYFYYVAAAKIGVAVSDNPGGPFKDTGKPLIDQLPAGIKRGQNIDPDVFMDPKSGKTYLYWGNAFMAVCELNADMISIKEGTTKVLIDNDKFYSEGTKVFYRSGSYYFMWSKNDTRSPDYQVRYLKTSAPTDKIDASKASIILSKDPGKGIYATGHNTVINKAGTDDWYIIYHRFKRPYGMYDGPAAGYNREVCMDKIEFNKDGSIRPVIPTL